MYAVRTHYEKLKRELGTDRPLETSLPGPPILVVTMQNWTRVSEQALRAAMNLSRDIKVVHVSEEDKSDDFADKWKEYVEAPARGG